MARRSRKREKEIRRNRFILLSCISIILIFIFLTKGKNDSVYADYKEEYLQSAKPLAVAIGRKYDLYPSVVLAQSALESNWGTSKLSTEYHNYFGIKGNKNDREVDLVTSEFVNGKEVKVKEPFRQYNSMRDSFIHYGELISKAKRYKAVRDAKDYKEAAYAIKKSGYATDPKYAEKIIYIIENYNLSELDENY